MFNKKKIINDFIYLQNLKLTFVIASHLTVFVFEENDKKVIYAPCNVKPFPKNNIFKNADIMIIGNTVVGDVLKNNFI